MIRLKSLLLQILNEQGNEYANQYNWWVSYLQSPMYIARLKKEFPEKTSQQLETERDIRLKNLQSAKTNTAFVKAIGKEPGYISGVYYPKKYTGEYWDASSRSWNPQRHSITKSGHDDVGHVYLEKEYDPKNWSPHTGFETIPAHEWGHAVDDGGSRIPKSTIDKIYRYTDGGNQSYASSRYNGKSFDYYASPSEFINRIQPIRYLLNKQKIYDARKRVFNATDYDNMMKSNVLKNDAHFQDVFNSLKGNAAEKKKNFIDIMNSIAKLPIPNNLDVNGTSINKA